MKSKKNATLPADPTRTETWTKYRPGLCEDCLAGCCRLPVEVRIEDLVGMELIDPFAAGEPAKELAKKLRKSGVVAHFNYKHSIFTLAQRANADCLFLDQISRRCTIYEQRPGTCRNHPRIGPRAGYCAFQPKDQ
jgi:hypothetical protein